MMRELTFSDKETEDAVMELIKVLEERGEQSRC